MKGADMQEVFEKLIKKLEEYENDNLIEHDSEIANHCKQDCNDMNDCALCVWDKAIEIVKQEAERCKGGHFGCNTNGEHEKCNGCGLTYCKSRNKIWFGALDDGTDTNVVSNGWISCSERLPEEHKLYDITFKNSAGIHSDSAIYNPYLKRWLWDADETELVENEILAWAEKREPYQPKGE